MSRVTGASFSHAARRCSRTLNDHFRANFTAHTYRRPPVPGSVSVHSISIWCGPPARAVQYPAGRRPSLPETRRLRVLRFPCSRAGTMLLYEDHKAVVNAVAFSPDGRTLATGAGDGALVLRDTTGGPLSFLQCGPQTPAIHSVGYLPDGAVVVGHPKGWEVFRQDGGA